MWKSVAKWLVRGAIWAAGHKDVVLGIVQEIKSEPPPDKPKP